MVLWVSVLVVLCVCGCHGPVAAIQDTLKLLIDVPEL